MLVCCMCIAISPKNFVCIESEKGYYLVISKITFLDPFYSHQDRVKCVTIPHCTDCCTRMPSPKISFCESLKDRLCTYFVFLVIVIVISTMFVFLVLFKATS